METETTEGAVLDTTNGTGEGEQGADTIQISKAEFEKLNQTLGSLKRENKDLKKPKDTPTETPQTNPKADNNLLDELSRLRAQNERNAFRSAGIEHSDDIELARQWADKWKMDVDEVLSDEDFKVKLERKQTARANVVATSNVRGSNGVSQAKNTPEFYIQRGSPPTREEIPDRSTRFKVARAFLDSQMGGSGAKFYNEK